MAIKNQSSTPEASTPARTGSEIARIANLALGDLLAFLVFTIIGINSHKESLTISRIVVTIIPFLLGWFIVSPFLGAFRRSITENVKKMTLRTILAWLLAWPICLAIRAIFFENAPPPVAFAIVTLLTNLVFLLLWRVPYAMTKSLKQK